MTSVSYHYEIGAIRVSLRSDCPAFLREFDSLYGTYRRDVPTTDSITVAVKSSSRFPWARGPFTICGEGMDPFPVERRHEVLPHIEWMINWQVIRQRNEFIQLHAATMERDGKAIILPGEPGSGKSTLAAGLLAAGWDYLCDEFALIDPKSLDVHPFPRALCMKSASFPVVQELGLPLSLKTPYRKPTKGRVAFLNPLDVRDKATGQPSGARWVVFPKYVAGCSPRLQPMSRAEGAFELSRQCFNIRVHQAGAIEALSRLARGADCYRLVSGDLRTTCKLINDLVASTDLRRARCA